MYPKLNFENYGSATTNGFQLGTQGVAANQYSLGKLSTNANDNSNITNLGVTDTSTVLNPNGSNNSIFGQNSGFWSKDGGAGLVLGGVQVLGNLWNSYQSHKLAKEQMAFARDQWTTNLANQTQTYNTALEDRIRARHHTEGRSSGETDTYLEEHSL